MNRAEIQGGIAIARGELERIIAGETSSFRIRLFERELAILNAYVQAFEKWPTKKARAGIATVLETVALYTLDSIEVWMDEGIIRINQAESMKRLSSMFAVARVLSQ